MALILRCLQCGSNKLTKNPEGTYTCDSCGTKTDFDKFDESDQLKIDQALSLRQTAKFDEARVLYDQLKFGLPKDQHAPEVHFGLFACDYKVLFELDNRTGNRVPIFYSSSERTVFDNPNLNLALAQARDLSFKKYQEYYELASKVEAARMTYQQIVKYVTPFDIFICFKKTDLDGISDTKDYSAAMTLYQYLVSHFSQFKVFFSEKSLAEIPLTEYEPNIYYALHTSKILIVISSKRDYLESQWVKNEWSRFLAINKANAIIPVYLKGSNVNIFPSEILKNNAYEEGDYDRIFKAIYAIMNSDKIIKEKEEQERKRQDQIIEELKKRVSTTFAQPGTNLDNMFRRMKNELTDGMFEEARKICDSILNVDADHPMAWLYQFLIENKLKSFDEITTLYESNWIENRYIKKAIDFSTRTGFEDDKKFIEECIFLWIEHMVNESIALRKARKYDDAKAKLIKVATSIDAFGLHMRFDYYYYSFLLEMGCVNTDEIVSKQGITKNANFAKAMTFANDHQRLQLQEIIDRAKKNALGFEEIIASNNHELNSCIEKLKQTVDERCTYFETKKSEIELIIEKANENLLGLEDTHKDILKRKYNDLVIAKQKKDHFLENYSGFSEKLKIFLLNLRAITLATLVYAYVYIQMPDSIITSLTFIIPFFLLALVINYMNSIVYRKVADDGKPMLRYTVIGIFTGLIFLAIPPLIGYSRASYHRKFQKNYQKCEVEIKGIEETIKTTKKSQVDELKKFKTEISGYTQDKIYFENQKTFVLNQQKELLKENQLLSLDEGVILKVPLEKKMNLFKESLVKLEDHIRVIEHTE